MKCKDINRKYVKYAYVFQRVFIQRATKHSHITLTYTLFVFLEPYTEKDIGEIHLGTWSYLCLLSPHYLFGHFNWLAL